MPDKKGPSTSLSSSRDVGADVVRIVACFFVISIHFLLHIEFYHYPISSTNMYIMLVMRMLFTICVPLFMILTGYLMANKPLSFSHYAKGMRVVWIYLLACAACIAYKLWFCHTGTWDSHLLDILSFKAAPYSWYIEMYFGLYLMVPFLGLLYRHLPSKKWKIVLIISIIALNSLPKLINSFNFTDPGWWSDPTVSNAYQKIVPQWWYYNTYPIDYFFIGAYIKEYGLRMNGILHRALTILTLGLSVLFELWRSGGKEFNWGLGSEWDFFLTMILATLIFALLVQKDYSRIPGKIKTILKYVSGLTLLIFLVSYIFDEEFYKILKKAVPAIPDRLVTYFIVVPAVFFASMALSAVLDLIYRSLRLLCRSIKASVLSRRSGAPAGAASGTATETMIPETEKADPSPEQKSEGDETHA